ncbi:PAS domain-containing sensor histidine kinase [Aridibaculum aurantiacum]|uniref:PAS domain-containing sensor histidine kinase n=1 Tax=Aridibaculum aurantiacum TaxID=2810307 RepID=UPI001A976DAC|nr:PAS domain-containing protein [Aridibaculum aurantiacum]
MPTLAIKKSELSLDFIELPAYAQFILENKLRPFAEEQVRLAKEVQVPILKYLPQEDEALLEVSIPGIEEWLTSFSGNRIAEFITYSLQQWKSGQLPHLAKEAVLADDITLIAYVRKKGLLKFLPQYTNDVELVLRIVNEIDVYSLQVMNRSFSVYIEMFTKRIDEHAHFIEKINNTSPGLIYVFDLLDKKEVYTNNKVEDLLGYTHEELQAMGSNYLEIVQHPDDIPAVLEHFASFSTLKDGEITSFEHRLKTKEGKYCWIRNYESIFKRTEDGTPCQIIGIALKIDQEKRMAEQLRYREEQLLEAQELAEMGSFELGLNEGKAKVTPQVQKILKLQSGDTLQDFINNIHPADKEKVTTAITAAHAGTAVLDEEFRYFAGEEEKIIWSRGSSSIKNGRSILKGTVMDVTQRHYMVQRLQNSEQLYKEAQALTHIGNWTWLTKQTTINWSDEMYRIFDMQPQQEIITIAKLSALLEGSDQLPVFQSIIQDPRTADGLEYILQIRTSKNNLKILQVKTEVRKNEKGDVFKVIGTCQDITEKQLLINRLEKSENLYKQAQALSHMGNWSLNLPDRSITWSDEMYRIYEMEPGSQVSYEELRKYNSSDSTNIGNIIQEQIEHKRPHDFFYQINLPSGANKIIHSKGEVVTNSEGNVIQLVGTAQDVTQQKEIEKQLLDNQVFIKKIADATPSIISSYNINTGVYSFVSEGLKKLLGYEIEEPLEKGVQFFIDIMHPEDLPRIMEENNKALAYANTKGIECDKEMVVEFQYRIKNSSGKYRWLHTYGTVFDRNREGKVENILNISLDITEKVETERKLQEQEKFSLHIAEASPTILYLFDLQQNRFLYVNKEVTQVLGYLPEEILNLGNKVSASFLHPEDEIKNNENHIKYPIADGSSLIHQIEGRVKDRNGKWKWLLTREIVFKRDENGQAVQVIGSALDITDRKEMEQTLIQKTIQLQQSNSNLEEFAHIASHDLQEPLRKICTFGDRLLNNFNHALAPEGKVYLDKMINSSQRMQQLINDILSISLISGDKSYRRYSLQKVLDEVLQTLDLKIEKTRAIIQADQLPEANINPSQMRQLFQNLLSNSLKFVSKEETPVITIKTEYLTASKAAKYHLKNSSRFIQITISDNGIGFDAEYAEKIFAIFQRLHGRAEYEGTGIGLSICKKIVENHNGVIFASASPGGGATFTFIIPE